MLETIRRFALERLDEAGEASDTKQRHIEVYLGMADMARPHLLGPGQAAWLDRLEEDHDNFGAALDWADSQSEVDAADRLLWALWRFWQFRGHLYEGGRRADVVLALPGADPHNRCRAMEAAGSIAYWRGDLESCRRFYLDALGLARRIGQPALVAEALYNAAFGVALTKTAGADGVAEGHKYLEEAKELFARLGDRSGVAKTLWGQGTVLWGSPSGTNLEQAVEIFREAAALYADLDDVFQYGWCQRMLGRTLLQLGRADEAINPIRAALDVFLPARDSSAVTLILNDVSLLALRKGQEDRALHLIGAARALRESTGTDLVGFGGNPSEELEQLIESDGERSESSLAEGGRMSWDELVAYITDTLDQSS
jgi:non-specific serine/threonine protein kinase